MSTNYVYNIATDFPGGQFTSAISERLSALILAAIDDPLENIGSTETEVTITFTDELTAGEKTILDGDTSAPAGGLIAKSTEYFDVLNGESIVLDGSTLQQEANGTFSTVLTLQMRDGTGASIGGTGQAAIDIDPSGLAPVTATAGSFSAGPGQFEITVGPTDDRGIVALEIKCGSLPVRHVNVEFA